MKSPENIIRFDRVRAHDSETRTRSIDRQTASNIEALSSASKLAIERRVDALDREWDLERYLELTAATLSLIGIALGLRNRKVLLLPAVVLAFLAQHATHGWCPPVPLFRSLGVRTRKEIDAEKFRLLDRLRPREARHFPSR